MRYFPNKQITTGEGGVLVTDNEELAIAARSMPARAEVSVESGLTMIDWVIITEWMNWLLL